MNHSLKQDNRGISISESSRREWSVKLNGEQRMMQPDKIEMGPGGKGGSWIAATPKPFGKSRSRQGRGELPWRDKGGKSGVLLWLFPHILMPFAQHRLSLENA